MVALLGSAAIDASLSFDRPYRVIQYENGQIESHYPRHITLTTPGIGMRTYQKENNAWPLFGLVPSHVKIIGDFTPVCIQPRSVQTVSEYQQRDFSPELSSRDFSPDLLSRDFSPEYQRRDISSESNNRFSMQQVPSRTCEQLILDGYSADCAFTIGCDRDVLNNRYRSYLENMAREIWIYHNGR
ncbi:MAG TPA: hypothetical protein VLG50_06340 [Candidatus Saccharimonadales bacterium]|nr:hypothetical protein [Candidatus Saccharimonadales bacterium]